MEVNDKRYKKLVRVFPETDKHCVVISGMSGKFPRANNIKTLREKLYNKIDMIDDDERRWRHFNPEIPKRSGKIEELEKFDATYFGVHFKQAHTMDPQCRILMEVAYESVIDAGINPKTLRGTRTGVFIGACISESEKTWFYEKVSSGGFGITGCSRAMLANRISYTLGLNGPSFVLDTACSSSMYALDVAFTMMRNGEIDAAIIGGSNLTLHPFVTLQFARLGVLAADGYCRPFDKDASGYTRSETISCLFLQRKCDAKRIYAEVIYSKTNCDGYKSEGITFPAGDIQEKLLREFYDDVNISPNKLGFLEAHCTGTMVGDPEECRAIDNAICSQRTESLLVGSVKSNLGHSEPASGVCSIIKSIFAFETGRIAPNINFTTIKPNISALVEGRLIVVNDHAELKKPYIAVNSFGFGGANAHALLKANDKNKDNYGLPADDLPRIVGWAGRTKESVDIVLQAFEESPLDTEYIALLHNIQSEVDPGLVFRGFGVYAKNDHKSSKCLAKEIDHFAGIKRPVVWVFSGMGSQWSEMGVSLMKIPMFRDSIQKCHDILLPKGINLMEVVCSKDPQNFENIVHCFVGIAAIQIALVDMLRNLDFQPDYLIGHSVGELGCGYADGGLTAEEMILAAYYRGKVSEEMRKITGSMAAVGLSYKNIAYMLPPSIEVACRNSSDSCTISGPAKDVENFVAKLKDNGIFAKEVPCSNIAYHSRYIAHMGPQFLHHLREVIKHPKKRSSKWLSSSVPKEDWEQEGHDLCSAEYHTNNLLNSVLFEETFALLPTNSLTIEIAPHGLLQAILKRSMPTGAHVALTNRGNQNNIQFFMTALGKLFNHGIPLRLDQLYPKVEFPVSRGTPGISSLIKWDHNEDWFVTVYENMKTGCSGERTFKINLSSEDTEFLSGHVIDGKILLPAAFYLQLAWELFSLVYDGPNYIDVPVEFEDVKFLQASSVTAKTELELNVMIHYGSGNFEITESKNLLVNGVIRRIEKPTPPMTLTVEEDANIPTLNKKDFYKELKLRGYHYGGLFKGIRTARCDGMCGEVEWHYNWTTFIDTMLQLHLIGIDSRGLYVPTAIQKLRIYGSYHFNQIITKDPEDCYLPVYASKIHNTVIAGGIEIIGMQAASIQRRRSPGIPVLEKYQFIPHFPMPVLSVADAARVCIQIGFENTPLPKMKLTELDTGDGAPIISHFVNAIEDFPVISGDYLLLSEQNIELKGVRVEKGSISKQTGCYMIIGRDIITKNIIQSSQKKYLIDGGFIIERRPQGDDGEICIASMEKFKLLATIPTDDDGVLQMFQWRINKMQNKVNVVRISEKDVEFSWIDSTLKAIAMGPVIVYAQNEPLNGLLGLLACLRREPGGNAVRGVFIDDPTAADFDVELPFYKNQLDLGLGINVYRNGQWGTYRHLQLNVDRYVVKSKDDYIYANIVNRGDLTSFRWFQGPPLVTQNASKVVYAAVNFRDIMLSTGRLTSDIYTQSRLELGVNFGSEFSGYSPSGKRIMKMVLNGAMASHYSHNQSMVFAIPDHWSLAEAATVPVVYTTVYYGLFIKTQIKSGKRILIHAGSGGIGLAAIRITLAYGLEVFTTVSTQHKREFLLKMFPQLKESHIGNSRDTSFEEMIQRETNGEGVDYVLNSLAGDKLLASIRCLGRHGHFLEIGKFDMTKDTKLGMGHFLKNITIHPVLADDYCFLSNQEVEYMQNLIETDIANGIIKPLPSTIFPATDIEQAFRYMVGGKHIGKVVLQMRDSPDSEFLMDLPIMPQVYFDGNLSYVIPGGLGGFGLELADWMIIRGARKLLLSSTRGISNTYQSYRIFVWKSYGCTVAISTADISTSDGCKTLLEEAAQLGPVGGIFNLAVVLHDGIFSNQTPTKFKASFVPKSTATQHLDELSRTMCPQLKHFVVFSSLSCGRGNPSQTNYGMTNSIMERIIERRVANGLPGKAIQWGAVGEVGLVANLAEDKIDLEIGGTLQQRMQSCLHELDNLLVAPDPIVGSMVVAEKRIGRIGNESITETVMNIMSIRDLKSISLSTTLSEMGMDSLMAVEIKQTLERDFDLILTPQDLRSLTFLKLQEFQEAKAVSDQGPVKCTLSLEHQEFNMEFLVRNIGNEEKSHEIIMPLNTSLSSAVSYTKSCFVIPGLEGTVGAAWYKLGEGLKSNTYLLQLTQSGQSKTVADVTQPLFESVKSVLKSGEQYYIVGYSYGTFVALHLAGLFEKAGFRGHVLLIDGSPEFLKDLTLRHIGVAFEDKDIYNLICNGVFNNVCPEEDRDQFTSLGSYEEKIITLMELSKKTGLYSVEYVENIIHAMFNRIKMVAVYDLDNIDMIYAPITLVRPTEQTMQGASEDYNLSKFTKGKVTVEFLEGSHTTLLDNPALAEIINEFDPTLHDDRMFKKSINRNVASIDF